MVEIHKIRLRLSNAFLLLGDKPVLVDTGSPGEEGKILRALARHGVGARDLALILLTHAHTDHAGSARALREATGAPVALHPAESGMLRRGVMDPLRPVRPRHALLKPIVVRPFDGLEADLPLADGQTLGGFGLPARVVATPGHSPGSVSVVIDKPRPDRPNDAIAGDLLIGGYLGGLLLPNRPRLPYFADDVDEIRRSLLRLLSCATGRLHLGHGGPVETGLLPSWCDAQRAKEPDPLAGLQGAPTACRSPGPAPGKPACYDQAV